MFFLRSVAATLAIALIGSPALADEPWNPFAERDRRPAVQEPPPATATRADPRPYLAPMSRSDLQRQSEVPRRNGIAPPPASMRDQGIENAAGPAPSPFDSRPGTYAAPTASGGWNGGVAAEPIVERGELTPMIGSGPMPAAGPSADVWAGLDAEGAEQLLAPAPLPPASPALAGLVARLLARPLAEPRLEMVRTAALLRTGVAASQPPSANLASAASGTGPEAVIALMLQARADLAAGRRESACLAIKQAVAQERGLPAALKGEAIVIAGHCAIASGNREAGKLAASLARDAGYTRPFTIALLETVANGGAPNVPLTGAATLLDGLLAAQLETADAELMAQLAANADPALLAHLAADETLPPPVRLAAAERAAAQNIMAPAALADVWRQAAATSAAGIAPGAALERARLFAAAEATEAQFQKTRAIRTLLDSARRDGLYDAAAAALTPVTARLRPAQEISWFAETAIEVLAAGADYAGARQWLAFAGGFEPGAGDLGHWLMLVDIADAALDPRQRGAGFRALEIAAQRGRITPDTLHRLVAVLDALDYHVPIPLWNLASRTPQPQTGFLPETGLLTALKRASESRQTAATALLALRTISHEGTGATHLLGLGEAIRALKRAGLEADARRLGFEALFADWPRGLRR